MDDITDMPFRELCKEFGADVLITEFIASEALNRDAEKSLRKMRFSESQRPIGIQIFGADEGELLQCLEVVEEAKPDFIDINWGCPVRKVAGKGAGSGILQNIPKMLRITASMVKHAHLPVTVKTRIGYSADSMMITDFAEALQDTGIAALSIHGRTKTQMYSGTADWSMIGEVKNNPRMHIPIFGNGDITSATQAIDNKRRYGVDGILIGRGAIGNPWIFEQCRRVFNGEEEREVSVGERVEVCRRHLHAAIAFKGEHTAIFEMRKHYGAMRKAKPKKRLVLPDPVYGDVKVSKFVNHLMYDGKKSIAYTIFYDALKIVEGENNQLCDSIKDMLTAFVAAKKIAKKITTKR